MYVCETYFSHKLIGQCTCVRVIFPPVENAEKKVVVFDDAMFMVEQIGSFFRSSPEKC